MFLFQEEAVSYLYGEDSGQDGTGDANRPAVIQKLEERVGPEKQLRDDKVCSSVHLLLQVPEVLLIAPGLGMAGGVAWTHTRV